MFLPADAAVKLARKELTTHHAQGGLTASWAGADVGEAVLVRDLARAPSYWLVPIVSAGRVEGAIRVLGSGVVAAIEQFSCPAPVVTGIDAAQARRLAAEHIGGDESVAEPVYVHDGPPGREAWLVESSKGGKPARWIFVTAGGVYERPAGVPRDLERE